MARSGQSSTSPHAHYSFSLASPSLDTTSCCALGAANSSISQSDCHTSSPNHRFCANSAASTAAPTRLRARTSPRLPPDLSPAGGRAARLPHMTQQAGALNDGDYLNLWQSLQSQQNHTCTRHCVYKLVGVGTVWRHAGTRGGCDHLLSPVGVAVSSLRTGEGWGFWYWNCRRPCCPAAAAGPSTSAGNGQLLPVRHQRRGPCLRPELQPADIL